MKAVIINTFTRVYYNVLKQEIINNGMLDEDVFHDTFVFLHSAPDMPLTKKMFMSVYRFLLRRELSRNYTTIVPSETFFQLLADKETESETNAEEDTDGITAEKVKEYARETLSPDNYKLFCLRFVKELTLRQISEYVGRSTCYVVKRTEHIKSDISNHFQNQLAI